jgi:hypothetical protein
VSKEFFEQSPFKINISFHKLIESLEEIALSKVDYRSTYAKALLEEVAEIPELRTGIKDFSIIMKYRSTIQHLLSDLFPTALTHNEIKAITIPFQNFTFNYSERFKQILNDAGVSFDASFRDFDNNHFYIMSCCLILNSHYGQKIDLSTPLFYDIPDSNGIIKHYRVTYNADFIEIIPSENAPKLTPQDIDLLIDNYTKIDLWKEKFPEESYNLLGFGIVQLFDATVESAVSILKSDLLKSDNEKENFNDSFENIFRSIYKIPDLRVGFSIYNDVEKKLSATPYDVYDVPSYILSKKYEENIHDDDNEFYSCFYESVIEYKKVFAISDVTKFNECDENKLFATHLLKQNIQSFILAPIVKRGQLLGIVELVSGEKNVLNSLNANKLKLVLPYLVDTIDRYNIDFKNQMDAVIQKEYTSIHNSVYWKFRNEAQKYLQSSLNSRDFNFKEISFKEVYPLFGEIDVKGSSEHRNNTVKKDLSNQLNSLLEIICELKTDSNFNLLEQREFELKSLIEEIEQPLRADSEQQIQSYIETELHPIIKNSQLEGKKSELLEDYLKQIDAKNGMFYHERKKFDESITLINKKLSELLDRKQLEAQKIFPHYYERFKTDGIEHNLYIGASIEPSKPYDKMYLNNLRLWQLQTLCIMELEHHKLKKNLPYSLEVTSLILVFSSPITIRFRMDEKRFDVDGSYNARYEVVKKRIDKAMIKNSEERITEKEKITIVYSHKAEKNEYLKYIKYLQHKKILEETIEEFEIEELQGVSGLKGIRVKVFNEN